MRGFQDDQVFNGTFGELWFDGEYMAEVKKFRLTVNISYEEIGKARSLAKGHKMTGYAIEGEVTFHKVSSFVTRKISECLREGRAPVFTMIGAIDDPAAVGGERVVAKNCKFESMTLADWENGNLAEENYSFKAEDWDLLDVA